MASPAEWVAGARPRTLPAAFSPVLAGTGAAYAVDAGSPVRALLALVVALALQVGVNYANDYSDGIRGTDEVRVGPVRLVGQRLAEPAAVKRAAFAAFGLGAVAGLVLVALSGAWWLIAVGAACILAAWYYTGGEKPYGYSGLGEVYVFVFFGLVATLGTQFTQAGEVTWVGALAAVGVGALATAILVANNLRDIPSDTEHGKRTLAVRLGDARTRRLYGGLLVTAYVVLFPMLLLDAGLGLLAILSFLLAWKPARAVRRSATGRDLIPVLAGTGQLELLYAVLLGIGLVLS